MMAQNHVCERCDRSWAADRNRCRVPFPRKDVRVKRTHRGKPYWQCDECGVQVFVRRQEGIGRLEEADEEKDKRGLFD